MITKLQINNESWRVDDTSGFLRAKAVVIEDSVMPYTRDELGDIPANISADTIYLHAPSSSFADPKAIKSLTGALLTVGHEWQTINNENSVGHIAGQPTLEGEQLIAEVIVTDPDTIRRIQLPLNDPERLVELSSSYESDVHWGRGRTISGRDFDGTQAQFNFNHVALLPSGRGRGGESVRISNKKEADTMADKMDFTRVKLSNGKAIRVANEDVDDLEKSENEKDEKIKNAIDPAQMQEVMTELADIKSQMKELESQKSELEAKLMAAKEQIDAALSPAVIEEAAVELANDKHEAEKIFNSIKGDTQKLVGLRGDDLKLAVVKGVRLANSLPDLTKDQEGEPSFVRGLYIAYSDIALTNSAVSGAAAARINNSTAQKTEPQIKRVHAGDKS